MRVIALVGMPGAGKTVVSNFLKEQGFPVVRFGQIVVNEVLRRGLSLTPANEQLIRSDLREAEGKDVCVVRSLPMIKAALKERGVVIIDGLYSFSEYKRLRREFGSELIVIAIAAARANRYRRLAERPERPFSLTEAEQRDYHEIESIEKGGPIAMADYTLINDHGKEELFRKVEEIVRPPLNGN